MKGAKSYIFCDHWLNNQWVVIFEPRREKTRFLPMQKQRRRSGAVTAQLISTFVFSTRIVQFLFSLNAKFQASDLV